MKLYMKTGIRKFVRSSGLLRRLPGDFEHLDDSLPSMSDQFFSAAGQVVRPRGVPRGRVALLAGCVMPLSHASTMEAATRVLAHNGVEVVPLPRVRGVAARSMPMPANGNRPAPWPAET